jgi:hypothetical protein
MDGGAGRVDERHLALALMKVLLDHGPIRTPSCVRQRSSDAHTPELPSARAPADHAAAKTATRPQSACFKCAADPAPPQKNHDALAVRSG